MTPVLWYLKNVYHKKNKHRYSVWTGIPPSTSCKGKISLFSFPKNPALRMRMQFIISGQFFQVYKFFPNHFSDECFINKAQFDVGFAHHLMLKDEAVPAIKAPGHDSEPQSVSKTASNICFVGNRRSSARDSLALPTARLQELSCFRRES